MLFPCMGCGDRYAGCHSHCDKYKEAKAAYDAARSEERRKQEAYNVLEELSINRQTRLWREGQRKKR